MICQRPVPISIRQAAVVECVRPCWAAYLKPSTCAPCSPIGQLPLWAFVPRLLLSPLNGLKLHQVFIDECLAGKVFSNVRHFQRIYRFR